MNKIVYIISLWIVTLASFAYSTDDSIHPLSLSRATADTHHECGKLHHPEQSRGITMSSEDGNIDRFKKNVLVFSGNANPELAQKVLEHLNIPLGRAQIGRFNDGETLIQVGDNVRNKDIFIIQPTCPSAQHSVNDNLMELYLLIRAMKRSSAGSITVVIPYFGYARQDRKGKPRVPISAADVAHMIEKAGATRVVTIDLHCGQIQGFFQDIPVDNLYASLIFTPYIAEKKLSNIVIVAPDAGGVERANQFIYDLERKGISTSMAVISKQRAQAGVIASMQLIGNVQDADAIIIDDICDTGSTLVKAAQLLKDHGARRVFAVVTHPVFSGQALKIIGESVIEEMIITDTIPLRGQAPANIKIVSVAPLLAQAILRVHAGESLSSLFKE